MATSRLLLGSQNLLFGVLNVTSGALLKNGTGGGAPALEQDVDFPMTNALFDGRYRIWKTSVTPPVTLDFDFDLGSSVPATMAVITGVAGWSGWYFIDCEVKAMTGGSYPGSPTWTSVGTITGMGSAALRMIKRDGGITFASQSARYWRFEFSSVAGQISVGCLWLGLHTDLGILYSPGSMVTQHRIRTALPMPSGAQVFFDQGRTFRDFALQFRSVPGSVLANITPLIKEIGTCVFADDVSDYWQFVLTNLAIPYTRIFNDSYDVGLEMSSQP